MHHQYNKIVNDTVRFHIRKYLSHRARQGEWDTVSLLTVKILLILTTEVDIHTMHQS